MDSMPVMSAKALGMWPWREFQDKFRCLRLEQPPMEDGMSPVKWLPDKSDSWIIFKLPICSGIWPSKKWKESLSSPAKFGRAKITTEMEERFINEAGIEPVKKEISKLRWDPSLQIVWWKGKESKLRTNSYINIVEFREPHHLNLWERTSAKIRCSLDG